MIAKLRKIIAYATSVLVMLISLGFIKPNFSGAPTISSPDYNEKSAISTDIGKDRDS